MDLDSVVYDIQVEMRDDYFDLGGISNAWDRKQVAERVYNAVETALFSREGITTDKEWVYLIQEATSFYYSRLKYFERCEECGEVWDTREEDRCPNRETYEVEFSLAIDACSQGDAIEKARELIKYSDIEPFVKIKGSENNGR